jgi:hypothetical protein
MQRNAAVRFFFVFVRARMFPNVRGGVSTSNRAVSRTQTSARDEGLISPHMTLFLATFTFHARSCSQYLLFTTYPTFTSVLFLNLTSRETNYLSRLLFPAAWTWPRVLIMASFQDGDIPVASVRYTCVA